MYKRYLTVIIVLVILVGCFFLFFDKPTNKELYQEYLEKLQNVETYDDLNSNNNLNIDVEGEYINNQYHYVLTFTSTTTLNNFKAMAIIDGVSIVSYYPSFGIIDNENINLVNDNAKDNETKGVNLVVTNRDKVETFKVYVSYNSYEYYYLINVGE